MKRLKILSKSYSSTHKIGEYEFLIKVRFIPLLMISKLARVRVELIRTKVSTSSWNKSAFVRRSEYHEVAQMFISSYLEEVDYFKVG
jgi:hypothetical protein